MLLRSSFTRGNNSAGTTCPAAPVSIVGLMFTNLSLTSTTFVGDAQELISTLSNDSWANFFIFSFDVLLVTSCHCSSSLMFLLSFFYSVRTPVPTPLTQFAAAPADVGHIFATFLLPFCSYLASGLGPLSLNSTIRTFFSLLPLLKYCCTLQLAPFLPVPSTCLHTASSDVFSVSFFECFLAIGSCGHADLHWRARINFLHFGYRMCRDLVYDVVLQLDEQATLRLTVWYHGIDCSAQLSGLNFFLLLESFFVSDFSKPSFVLFRLVDEVSQQSSKCSTSFARSRALMSMISAAYAKLRSDVFL